MPGAGGETSALAKPKKSSKRGVHVLRRNMGRAPASPTVLPPPPPDFNDAPERVPVAVDLAVRVASAVGGEPVEGAGLQGGVTAALASALAAPPAEEPPQVEEAPTPARPAPSQASEVVAAPEVVPEPVPAPPDPQQAAPMESASQRAQASASMSQRTQVSSSMRKGKEVSKIDRVANIVIAVVGGLIIAWILLTYLAGI
jgi:hypothetical protein